MTVTMDLKREKTHADWIKDTIFEHHIRVGDSKDAADSDFLSKTNTGSNLPHAGLQD